MTAVDESEIVLVNFPDNYKLFVHFSQESSAPREDTYLYGTSHMIFSSFTLFRIDPL